MGKQIKHISRSMTGFRGKSPSKDGRTMIPARSILEQDTLALAALSRGVKSYASYQREEIYYDGPKQRRCYPDYELDLRSGTELILDIHSVAALADEGEMRRFSLIAAEFERRGRLYRVVTEKVVYREPQFSNVKRLVYHRNRFSPSDDVAGMVEWLREKGPTSLAALQAHFNDARFPLRLIADGHFRCDLNRPLVGESLVEVAPDQDDQLLF